MFDKEMLDELSKLKVERKKKQNDLESFPEEETVFAEIPPELPEENEFTPLEQNQGLENLSRFITDTAKKELDPNIYIGETDPDNDFSTNEEEAKAIRIAGRQAAKAYLDETGTEVKSKYLSDSGDINVVYHEPGKNVINRKSIEERRFDVKMEALSGLLSRFKTDEELEEEANLISDEQEVIKKEIKKIDQIVNIQNEIEIKISMVKNAFISLSHFFEKRAGLPPVDLSVTSPENLRSLYERNEIEEMEVAKLFLLALFLENPDNFPSHDTFEEIVYRSGQVGARPKQIDLKRIITYIASDSEFQKTVDDLLAITRKNLSCNGLNQIFLFKCQESLTVLREKYFKGSSADPLNRVNLISIQKDLQFKYRNIESTGNFIDSLKNKAKLLPANFKEQIARTLEQIQASELKFQTLSQELAETEKEIAILLLLTIAETGGGYLQNFYQALPVNEVSEQLTLYGVKTHSEPIKRIFSAGIKEEDLNQILKNR